ncbi:death domain-associated protein 6-like [Pollicipes pollicipes]|uniref:death domain-associated protein 6-like n=1 Tax=Pollicipes pollicipes TaxID=41117 RepID=UPI00188510FA|nr:death domain-associated protein 6-like [Pollicipes pollicipes]
MTDVITLSDDDFSPPAVCKPLSSQLLSGRDGAENGHTGPPADPPADRSPGRRNGGPLPCKRVSQRTMDDDDVIELNDSSEEAAGLAGAAVNGRHGRVKRRLEPSLSPSRADPCQRVLDELCALLRPLLAVGEERIVQRLQRKYAAVLALSPPHSGRWRHILGVAEQCAAQLRAEPRSCFTLLRGFFEQLDQIKLVAASALSRSAPAAAAQASQKPVVPEDRQQKEARRHRRHVAKLEKTLRRLEREIGRREACEVDWDDGADSAYMVGARLKRRYVQVYRRYCRLVGAEEETERLGAPRIRFQGTRYPEINRRIEKFVNRSREFPDFKDVLSQIETANRHHRLLMGPGAIHDQAKDVFLTLGRQLQRRRRAALAESMDALCGADQWRSRDPAEGDASVSSRLAENAQRGRRRLDDVFSEFVERQASAAAERRKRRVAAGGGASGEEDQDDDEEEGEDDEEAEESEVTDDEDEEEQEPAPASALDAARDRDSSEDTDGPSEAEGLPGSDEDMAGPAGSTAEDDEAPPAENSRELGVCERNASSEVIVLHSINDDQVA